MKFNSPKALATAAGFLFAITLIAFQSRGETTVVISPNVPIDNVDYFQSDDGVQQQLEELSWRYFIALCWPAEGNRPLPDTNQDITQPGQITPVWQNFGMNYDIYLIPEDIERAAWRHWDTRKENREKRWATDCPDLVSGSDGTDPYYYPVLDEFIQAGLGDRPHFPLIDRSGQYVHTGVYYNKEVYNYVVDNKLYDKSTFASILGNDSIPAFSEKLNEAQDTLTVKYRLGVPDGAVMIKSSWKILDEHDDAATFHTTLANLIFLNHNVDLYDDTVYEAECSQTLVGLVGFHLVYKTPQNPYWVWSSFEHKMNAPDRVHMYSGDHYSFYTPTNPTFDKDSINKRPKPNRVTGDSTWFAPTAPNSGQIQTQIVRKTPISASVALLNTQYATDLGSSVWANYVQVATQWSRDTTFKADTLRTVYPDTFANTTLESFEQSIASCMGCHNQVSGLKNNSVQEKMGNIKYLPMHTVSDTTNPDTTVVKILYSDFMWSSLKYMISGHLTSRQIGDPKQH